MAITRDEVIRQATNDYLDSIVGTVPLPTPSDIAGEIVDAVNTRIDIENASKVKGRKWNNIDGLLPAQIALIILRLYPVAAIETAGENSDKDYTLLGLYQDDGPNQGIYITDESEIKKLVRKYNFTITGKARDEVLELLQLEAPRKKNCREQDIIAVNNGLFDFKNKVLKPFSSDYVFTTKCRVNYNPNAKNVVIHNPVDGTDWDVVSWIADLSDDPGIVKLLWQILGAIIRPNVSWNKSAWFYSETGNNGKGTLCELMRQLVGEGSYVSIPLSDMGKDFMLEPLTRASAIIVDENDVATYIDKAANLKAIITGDVIQINRKFKMPIPYQFKGFMVQCLNEMPRIKDKSDSFFRRQIFIPFDKCFTGVERKYIKTDYLHRQEVLEFVLLTVLQMDYYELEVPESCKLALEELKEFNDPVRQFMEEIMPQLQWDLVPFGFLHDLYKSWYKKNIGGKGETKSKNSLNKDILQLLHEYPEWTCENKNKTWKTASRMDKPEPLIVEFDLVDWKNPLYKGNDVNKIARPVLKDQYRGLVRLH